MREDLQLTSLDGLRADCASCFGLCCVAPAFAASSDFAVDKPAGRACAHLGGGFRCDIHSELRERGFPGCTVFDCFGAGQKVSQVTFGGRDWREHPDTADAMFAAFAVLRPLQELLYHLTEARALAAAAPLRAELDAALADTERLTLAAPDELATLDVAAHRGATAALLRRASELARAGHRGPSRPTAAAPRDGARAGSEQVRAALRRIEHRGGDLFSADLRGADLRGADLRGACLVGADLRGADLTAADVTGADLRGADLTGAELSGCLFLLQSQLDAARGGPSTRLPATRTRPAHWAAVENAAAATAADRSGEPGAQAVSPPPGRPARRRRPRSR